MKNIILINLFFLSAIGFSQTQAEHTTLTKEILLTVPAPEVVEAEVLPVEIEITETEERIITKKTYQRIIVFTSEIKED